MAGKYLEFGNAKIGFRNFAGRATQFTPEGRRKFSVFLEPDIAERLAKDGWNVKEYRRNENEDAVLYLDVFVSYDHYPPKIELIGARNKIILDENELKILDGIDIAQADIVISPYHWEINKKKGIKAFLKALYITQVEDNFAEKYSNIPFKSSKPMQEEDDIPF